MIQFGKPSGPMLRHKQDFLTNNRALAARADELAALYASQPPRTKCMNCDGDLGPPEFTKRTIGYAVCDRCGQLNGVHQDTDAFCQAVYADQGGKQYAQAYGAPDRDAFQQRMHDIYVPKAEFLFGALKAEGIAPEGESYADLGAGSGYFVGALMASGAQSVTGYEVSEAQVALADKMLGAGHMSRHGLNETGSAAAEIGSGVVSMIGVLEHLQQPRAVLAALAGNKTVHTVYLSLPLFSPAVYFELIFPDIFPRHLSGGHTHLYTDHSIDWMCREYGFKRSSEWWFGADAADLFRSIRIKLENSDDTAGAAGRWTEWMEPMIDGLQRVIDERQLASEVHLVLRKRGNKNEGKQ
jgi:hypothetical protein